MKVTHEMIRYTRHANGFNQIKMSNVIGLSQAYYSQLERGNYKVTEAVSKRFIDTFGFNEADLINMRNDIGRQSRYKLKR
ncbi:helix-turn-helix domain-containing protein [Jeotgalicoccus halotolerans]|uniref:Helix-turn-helix protein n=1 Tax=Jeotgalicoccus halotolerans TaxID=157227 RepID=A0A3E0AVR4_9STAP|nr:helix-turn-helix transcriptional regulator [Jeotgalicoccus halotolerans]REG23791.1 helix-turn-helix protein [Jeotgalicoccus halotolerans]